MGVAVDFLRRGFPNANSVWLDGTRPVLVDSGAPGGEAGLLAWLGVRVPRLLVNTHGHSDHAGGNGCLAGLGVPVAAEAAEAALVNAGDADAGRAQWLRQHVPAYRVSRSLSAGEVIDTGDAAWRVVALPGHTAGQIGLFDPAARVLVAGDAVHGGDLGWLDLDADPCALDKAEATVEVIAGLAPRLLLSGHGAAVTDVDAALAGARRRLASWRAVPERIAWHACKRIFGHLLFTEGGLARDRVAAALVEAPWFRDHAVRAFSVSPGAFVPMLVEEMLRSGAASWRGERLVPGG